MNNLRLWRHNNIMKNGSMIISLMDQIFGQQTVFRSAPSHIHDSRKDVRAGFQLHQRHGIFDSAVDETYIAECFVPEYGYVTIDITPAEDKFLHWHWQTWIVGKLRWTSFRKYHATFQRDAWKTKGMESLGRGDFSNNRGMPAGRDFLFFGDTWKSSPQSG